MNTYLGIDCKKWLAWDYEIGVNIVMLEQHEINE